MKPYKLSGAVAVAAILFCLGFAAPAEAVTYSTFTCTLTRANPQSTNTSPNPCTKPDGTPADARNILSGEGYWNFEYTVVGNVSFLGLQIKNNPGAGDICFVVGFRQPRGTNVPFSTNPKVVEEAYTSACGTQFMDTNGPPLTLFAYIQTGDANPDAGVTLTVHYPTCSSTDGSGNCTTENGFALNRMGLQQRTVAKFRDQGSALANSIDPVVDESRRRVLLG